MSLVVNCGVLYFVLISNVLGLSEKKFPNNFKFGVASSSYQIEGAWNHDGKGENIWDRLTHTNPNKIENKQNGDIACDSYHQYKEDVKILKNLNVDYYRFSLSWARILPNGFANNINWKGVKYYKNLIKLLLENNIQPMVTLYHWDLPQTLQDLGGWTNPLIEEYFADYARLCFSLFGDDVKFFTTINEPRLICYQAYGVAMNAPGIYSPGIGEYLCGHHVLKAHAKAYHIYDEEFRPTQHGKINIVIDFQWAAPVSNSTRDLERAETSRQFWFGWFANPVFNGDYPKKMIERVLKRSLEQGFKKSKLPVFTEEEVKYIKGTSDNLGVNTYTTYLAAKLKKNLTDIGWEADHGVNFVFDPQWENTTADFFKVVPWGTREILKWIKNSYNNPEILITENGYAAASNTDEVENRRIYYHQEHLSAILEAIYEDDVNVTGYIVWSILDNFEWVSGYGVKFGLYAVDFSSPNRTRTPKKSAYVIKNIFKNHCLVKKCQD